MKMIRIVRDSGSTDTDNIDAEAAVSHHATPHLVDQEAEQVKLNRASKIAKFTTAIMTLILLILWPMPLYGTGYVFSLQFFSGWVIVGIIWLICSTFAVGVYPLWEGRDSLRHTFVSIYKDLTGRGRNTAKIEGRREDENDTTSEHHVEEPMKTKGEM